MTVMVNMNDDLQATDREYVKWKRDPRCLPLAEILRVEPKKIASRYLGYLPPHIYPSSCFLYFGVVSKFAGYVYYQI